MFVAITNTPRDYAWGSPTAIAELLGTVPSGGPEAELWLGAHPGSPARLAGDNSTDGRTLLDVVDGRLPFLLKVLAAASPLSLQAHPTMAQAQEGFARENAAGVPVDAPNRNYKDAFHKPELIYALSESFTALCGFRPVAQTRAQLAPLADDARVAPLLERLVDDGSLRAVFEWLITRGTGVDALVEVLSAHDGDGLEWETVRLLAGTYPGDPGIAISLLLNCVELSPGEVLYLPAGNIHAYLNGLGIELMASSDNVLRGGLTPKYVDVPELLSVLDFRPVPVPYLEAEHPAPGVSAFRPDVPDFVLQVIQLADGLASAPVTLLGPAIALCTAGSVELVAGADSAALARGESLYIADVAELRIAGAGTVFVATTGR